MLQELFKKKPNEEAVIRSNADIENVLLQIAWRRNELRTLENERLKAIDKVNERHNLKATNPKLELERLETALKAWGELHKDELLKSVTGKTLQYNTGKIGWRRSKGRLVVDDTTSAIESLQTQGLGKYLSTRVDIRKQQLFSDWAQLPEIDGIKRTSPEETFFIET